jgi:glycosyltransferase involved in cell wall biosynthesis
VAEGETGFVAPPADPAALRARLADLAASPELRRRMGAAGRARFLESFSFERMYERTMAVYAELAASPRREAEGALAFPSS